MPWKSGWRWYQHHPPPPQHYCYNRDRQNTATMFKFKGCDPVQFDCIGPQHLHPWEKLNGVICCSTTAESLTQGSWPQASSSLLYPLASMHPNRINCLDRRENPPRTNPLIKAGAKSNSVGGYNDWTVWETPFFNSEPSLSSSHWRETYFLWQRYESSENIVVGAENVTQLLNIGCVLEMSSFA